MNGERYAVEAEYGPWKVLVATLLLAAVSFFFASSAAAAVRYTAEAGGIEAIFRVSPKMADLLLVDRGTGKSVTGATVELTVTRPEREQGSKKTHGHEDGGGILLYELG